MKFFYNSINIGILRNNPITVDHNLHISYLGINEYNIWQLTKEIRFRKRLYYDGYQLYLTRVAKLLRNFKNENKYGRLFVPIRITVFYLHILQVYVNEIINDNFRKELF